MTSATISAANPATPPPSPAPVGGGSSATPNSKFAIPASLKSSVRVNSAASAFFGLACASLAVFSGSLVKLSFAGSVVTFGFVASYLTNGFNGKLSTCKKVSAKDVAFHAVPVLVAVVARQTLPWSAAVTLFLAGNLAWRVWNQKSCSHRMAV